ncbi:MAG: NAD(P)/FAD-dependent oxidoreductase, partial [Planctomycetes bacterium]|nr:NAD(P)/FAD-dependent oxidoreductase [Planctomycetota bacterium]
NFTHEGTVSDLVRAYGEYGRFLKHCLYEFSGDAVREFFAGYGVDGKVEKGGCVFPVSDKAGSIKKVLLDAAAESGLKFFYGRRVEVVERRGDVFFVTAGDIEIDCRAVIISTGGKSWPGLGSTGDGYAIAKAFGHTIVEPRAALVGLVVEDDWVRGLQGVAVGDVQVWAKIGGKKVSERGPLMFTDKGVGGPSVFNFSRFVVGQLKGGLDVYLDLLPAMSEDDLRKFIIDAATESPKKGVVSFVSGLLPKRLAEAILERVGVSGDVCLGQFGKKSRSKLVEMIKRLRLKVMEAGGFAEATITRGGVRREEIDSKTMESKICPGLYFAGEVIDADGPCGGYNLQIAWSTGMLAGLSAVKK